MTFNALAALVDALKVWPEELTLPEPLEDGTAVELAEARNRFQQMSQTANELRRLVDHRLAELLKGGGLPYGNTWYRPATTGKARVIDEAYFYEAAAKAVRLAPDPQAMLAALFPTDRVKVGGLSLMAEVLKLEEQVLKDTLFAYDDPSSPLDVVTGSRVPKFVGKLREGEVWKKAEGGGGV